MDGNNRWSKANDIDKYKSYKKGANKLIEITNYIFDNYKINYVSAFALSKHNFKRGKMLITMIENLLIDFLNQSREQKNIKYRVKFIGNLNFLPSKLIESLKKHERLNIKSKKTLLIYLNYSGKDDIHRSINFLSKFKKYNLKNFKNSLDTAKFPEPDMLIRSGGFKRLSDFMLYQLSFTELFFLNKLWPDIKKADIKKFIDQFYKIDRKFGN